MPGGPAIDRRVDTLRSPREDQPAGYRDRPDIHAGEPMVLRYPGLSFVNRLIESGSLGAGVGRRRLQRIKTHNPSAVDTADGGGPGGPGVGAAQDTSSLGGREQDRRMGGRDGDRPDGTVRRPRLLGTSRRPAGVGRGSSDHGSEQPGGQRDGRKQCVARKSHEGARKNGVRIADALRYDLSAHALDSASKLRPNSPEARLQCSTCDSSGERCTVSRSCSWSSRSSLTMTSPTRWPSCPWSSPALSSSCRTRSCYSPFRFSPESSACSRCNSRG